MLLDESRNPVPLPQFVVANAPAPVLPVPNPVDVLDVHVEDGPLTVVVYNHGTLHHLPLDGIEGEGPILLNRIPNGENVA
jgi:hypothetical protein